ncbi:hypothetical protein GE21DRAFT_1274040 [Neurospora crassa]|nr:hypothetical protein GE21DRAFT_1274040 [Neurospora crassa]
MGTVRFVYLCLCLCLCLCMSLSTHDCDRNGDSWQMVAGSLVVSDDVNQSGRFSNREDESKDEETEQLNGKFAGTMLTKLESESNETGSFYDESGVFGSFPFSI